MAATRYDKEPAIVIDGFGDQAWSGYSDLCAVILQRAGSLRKERVVVAVDCYHGVDDEEVLGALQAGLRPVMTVLAASANRSNDEIAAMLADNITDDRIFGVMSSHRIEDFFDGARIAAARSAIEAAPDSIAAARSAIEATSSSIEASHASDSSAPSGIVLVYGIGAALLAPYDLLIYADMARWEIQLRMRKGLVGNWCADNREEEFLRRYKRAFFIDWRVLDRHKVSLFGQMDYLLDTNSAACPKMITGEAFLAALAQAARQPFRVVPFFDPGPWGGQWMKEKFGLDDDAPNYAWCFDCVPEENSLYLQFGDIRVEVPAMDLIRREPQKLLGKQVYARFGAEFPIRFDFLDTMGGGNLSLQVHPSTAYIQETFGMQYTQDESYYMLDTGEDAAVYLGLRTGIDQERMLSDLDRAQNGEIKFDADLYAEKWPAAKHDHFLIPAGTVHCSGKNSMVLEISATPYIFTFKLWDWDRLGMDGRPRPINIGHGRNVIRWDRDTAWTRANLVNRIERVAQGDGWVEERTGLHALEFIETRRHWFTGPVHHDTGGNLNVLNLVEGEEAIITSPGNHFAPFIVHYAETFILPGSVGEYVISPHGVSVGKRLGTIKAFVRV
ncbi:MAG: class I mannose-6-phosphate isomerase [Saccharofermentanales bacterium]